MENGWKVRQKSKCQTHSKTPCPPNQDLALYTCCDTKLQLQYDLHFAQCGEMLHRTCSKHASSTFNETQAFRKSSVSCKACLQSVASASPVMNNLWLSCESAPNPLCPWNALGFCQFLSCLSWKSQSSTSLGHSPQGFYGLRPGLQQLTSKPGQ